MNRTKRQAAWNDTCAADGELLVATSFDHPGYGPAVAPAAALVAAALRAEGHDARAVPAVPADHGTSRSWHGFAYLDPRLGTVGLAVGARADDPDRQRVAARCTADWERTVATRRILLPGFGVPVPRGSEPAGLRRSRRTVRAFLRRGDAVLVIGPATTAFDHLDGAEGRRRLYTVPGPAISAELERLDPDRVSFVFSPEVVVEDAIRTLRVLRARFPALRGQHPDEWPYRPADRLDTLVALCSAADEVWSLSPSGRPGRLLGTAVERTASRLRVLTDPTDVRPDWLALDTRTIALVPGPAARTGQAVHRLTTLLGGLGPLSVVQRQMHSTVLPFAGAEAPANVPDRVRNS
ncbi:hypothetical protein ACIRPK_30045 [Kitasatospora sp. NPDC101801]|uniref:hypothetical protein n=1 Tax=Kitasatospora sp. NPDC101801 TaxID=3364103 RepID=UPI0038130BFA